MTATTSPRVPGRTPDGRLWFAQALRAVAALMVVWGHLADGFGFAQEAIAPNAFVTPIPGVEVPVWKGFLTWFYGFHGMKFVSLGVILFFLVSGFVIPYSLEGGGPGRFAIRRFFRLYPTLWVCMALTTVVVAVWTGHRGVAFPIDVRDVLSSGTLVAGYVGERFVDGVYWTLAVEEMFYVLAAFLAWRRWLTSPWALLATGGLLTVVGLRFAPAAGAVAEHTAPFHFWFSRNCALVVFILVGTALHHLYRRTWSPAVGIPVVIALLLMIEFSVDGGALQDAEKFSQNGIFAVMLFVGLMAVNDRLPYVRGLDWVANISYPLYALHAGIGWILMYALYPRLGRNVYLTVFTVIAIVIVLAAAVHYVVERPTIALGRRVADRVEAARLRRVAAKSSDPAEVSG